MLQCRARFAVYVPGVGASRRRINVGSNADAAPDGRMQLMRNLFFPPLRRPAGGLRVAAWSKRFKAFRWINNNRYFRVGPTKWPGTQGRIPVLRIGTQRGATWNHWRLTVRGR
jgi:hypothetical protein